MVIVLAVCAVH